MANFVKFLGTAGARFAVSQQVRASGGLWFEVAGSTFHVDPGPGALVRAVKSRPRLDPAKLDAVVLSHRHLDHSNDVNVMVEAMTNGGFDRHGLLLAPRECYEDDPVIRDYVKHYVARCEILQAGSTHSLGRVTLSATRLPHRHKGAETYGLLVKTEGLCLGYVADTRFFEELPSLYSGCQVLIVNCARRANDRPDLDHLNLETTARLLQEVRPETGILTHFGMTMLKADVRKLASELADSLGLEVLAASDGWAFSLDRFLEVKSGGCKPSESVSGRTE